jgi:hypothetical protein
MNCVAGREGSGSCNCIILESNKCRGQS